MFVFAYKNIWGKTEYGKDDQVDLCPHLGDAASAAPSLCVDAGSGGCEDAGADAERDP